MTNCEKALSKKPVPNTHDDARTADSLYPCLSGFVSGPIRHAGTVTSYLVTYTCSIS